MKNIKAYITITLLSAAITCIGQQQNRYWYFGNNIGIDFGLGLNNPTPIDGIGNNTREGTGVISDHNGNFLFYTDGTRAINSQGTVITTDLSGDPSSTQSSMVIPSPGNCNEIYVFSVDFGFGNDGMGFNIVDTQNWQVTASTNLCNDCFEKVTSIPHSNGEDHWIISVRPNSRRVPVYLLNSQGVTLIQDQELNFLPSISNVSYGSIKGSNDGSMLAIAYGGGGDNRVELLNFNNMTGEIEGYLNTYDVGTAYGIEFSPNNEYILISGIGNSGSSTVQGSLSRYETSPPYTRVNNIELNRNSAIYEAGALQIGPDNKIYMARDASNYVDVINTPDNPNDWGYQEQAIVFDCTQCVLLGLPNLVGAPNECNPCDLSNSLIPNPDFENVLCEPQGPAFPSNNTLECADGWVQATEATSDFFSVINYPNRTDLPNYNSSAPPNGSDHFVAAGRSSGAAFFDPQTGEEQVYLEYVGACLLSPLIAETTFTIVLDLGAPEADNLPALLESEIVVLGIPTCNFPITGFECKEDNYEIIGRTSIAIIENTWQQAVEIELFSEETYPAIMFGLKCVDEPGYLLIDNILVIEGENPCPSDCFSITAEAPPCNTELETESESTYTYDFTFRNETDSSFSQILLFDDDNNFTIDEGTLLDLETTLMPGQSVDLSWDINANNYVAEAAIYCFDIAPYNHNGPCCKAQHCVELESCCTDIPGNTKNMIDSETECCYAYGYDSCIPDFYVSITFDMLTEGLSLSVSSVMDGFQVSGQEGGPLMLTRLDGGFFPEGTLENVLEFCVEGMGSESPEMQELSMTWGAIEGDGVVLLEAELCTLECPIPPDECAELIDPVDYCDDNFVYHYQFSVKNINSKMLEASIVVLGPVEDTGTVPGDFSQSTFPDFPDHTPNGDPYLEYNETTEVYDITLPNASLGSSYEFIISLHDYRNINAEDGEYWCCYTPVSFTIDVTVPCGGAPEINTGMEYIVYPNPLEDVFVMKFDQVVENNTTLIISDLNGNIVKSESLRSKINTHRMEVSDLSTGIYYISVYNDAGLGYHQRFVKR